MLAKISAHNGTTFTLEANTGNLGSQTGDANYTYDLTAAMTAGDDVILGPTVTINGDGTGALAYAMGSNTDGITDINIAEVGSGYHVANLAITQNTSSAPSTEADFRPVVSPVGGHGYNLVEELFGYNIMLNVKKSKMK